MPNTDRLYALSSTYNNPWWPHDPGPGLLINDAVVAMRWFLTHEREENLAVAGHVSADEGATWQPLHPRELLADAERALVSAVPDPGEETRRTAALLRDAMAAEAADWLDHRLRYVEPDDPFPYRTETPGPSSWRRAGQIWALTLGTVPHDLVLAHLTPQHAAPNPEGHGLLRTGALEMLEVLALADEPASAAPAELLGALAHLNRLTFVELGQLRALAQDAEESIIGHLITRLPETASVAEAHPDPQHPAHQAARAYLHRLSLIGADGEERLLADAAHALTEQLAVAEAAQPPPAPDTATEESVAAAIPGYPKRLPDDLQAAAQWRLLSPAARRSAERTMEHLVQAAAALTQAAAAADPHRFSSAGEEQALRAYSQVRGELDELTARHALLMHASVLADAEEAAVPAGRAAVIAAGEATEAQHARPRTAGELMAEQEAFMAHVNAEEGHIAQTLDTQRALTRDALRRNFPQAVTRTGLHTVRTQLIEHSGLGLEDYNGTYRALRAAQLRLESMEASYRSGTVEFGRPSVTAEQVDQARGTVQKADARFTEVQHSRPLTLRAVKALSSAAALEPAPSDSAAVRAARLAAQSRERTRPAAQTAPHKGSTADQQQTRDLQAPQTGSGVRLS
ncbi:hypothetical protein [Streptomyces sp. NPDC055140]